MIGMILFAVALVIVGACVGVSLLRGFSKSVLRGGVVLISALASIITCLCLKSKLSVWILDLVKSMDSGDIAEALDELNNVSPTLVELISQLIGALIAPIACLLIFFAIWIVLGIVCFIVSLILRKLMKKFNSMIPLSRLYAAIIGFAEGIVIVGMLFLPIVSYLSIGRPVLDSMIEQEIIEDSSEMEQVQDIIHEIDDAPVMVVHRVLGGEFFADTLMGVEVAGEKVNLRQELNPILNMAVTVMELGETEFTEYGTREAELIRSVGESFNQSKLLAPIVGDIVYGATDAWMKGETFLDMEKPSMGEQDELFGPFMDKLFQILHDDAKASDRLQKDIQTFADIIAIFVDSGVLANLEDEEKLVETLGGDGVVKSMVETLGQNESMKPLIPEITNLGVRAIGQVLKIPANADEVYGEFMDEVAIAINNTAALSDEKRVEVLTEQLTTAFDEAGVAIDPEILDFYSASMLHDLVENNDKPVTAEDVKAFFNIYAENASANGPTASAGRPSMDLLNQSNALAGTVYEHMTEAQLKQTATAILAGFCTDLSHMSADDQNFAEKSGMMVENAFGNLLGSASMAVLQNKELTKPISMDSIRNTAGMQSPDSMKEVSTVVTLDMLLIDVDAAAEKLTAEGILVEAQSIEAIFNAAGTLITKMSQGAELNLTEMAASVGNILDTLKQTESFGADKTAHLFTSIMQSETVRESANLDMATATLMANKGNAGNGSYTQTMTTVADSVSIADKLNKDEDISDAELEELIRNLNPQIAGMLEVYMTPDRMMQFGVPEKYSVTASDLTVGVFSYMGREDLKDYDKEAKGLNQILQMALASRENQKNKKLFSSSPNANDGVFPMPDEFIDKLMGSEAICYSLVDVLTDGQKVTVYDSFGFAERLAKKPAEQEALRNAIIKHRNNHPEKNPLAYEALASMFNMSLEG